MLRQFVFVVLSFLVWVPVARADWSLNLGYNNPPGSTLGGNFLYQKGNWGYEIGVGWVQADASKSASLALSGDMNLKYFFGTSGVRPYIQGGFGTGISGTVGKDTGVNAGLGGPFGGLGLMLGKSFYGYAAINTTPSNVYFVQAGVGFDI